MDGDYAEGAGARVRISAHGWKLPDLAPCRCQGAGTGTGTKDMDQPMTADWSILSTSPSFTSVNERRSLDLALPLFST